MRVAGILRVPSTYSRDILHQAKGDHLDQVHSDQMVLKMISRSSVKAKVSKIGLKGPSGYHSSEIAVEAVKQGPER
jgi:hypothetical protein